MNQILIYGGISGLSLIVGALVGIVFKLKQKTIAGLMAFGAGVLICALTFGLMEEAFRHGGFNATILGFLLGGLVFIAGDYLIHVSGGRKHKRHQLLHSKDEPTGKIITLGAILDGIPEAMALGVALLSSQSRGILIMVAIVLNNLPESISSISGLKKEGFKNWKILAVWGITAVAVFITALLSFIFLRDINQNTLGIIESFAAGAILAMVADSMMPEAYEEGGFGIAALTILGFLTAFIISRV